MFWGAEERQLELTGTGIEEDVENDVQHIEEEYNTIVVPFIRKHSKYFRYVKMVLLAMYLFVNEWPPI